MAPEIVKQAGNEELKEPYRDKEVAFVNSKADVWAIGCICYEMLTGITPIDGSRESIIY